MKVIKRTTLERKAWEFYEGQIPPWIKRKLRKGIEMIYQDRDRILVKCRDGTYWEIPNPGTIKPKN